MEILFLIFFTMKCSHERHIVSRRYVSPLKAYDTKVIWYKSHMKYIVSMWIKDLSGNLWRYGSYHVHVFLRFSVLVSHTQNRPAILVLLILSLTWFLDLGTYKDIIWDYLWPKKHLEKNLATKPTYFFFFCK